ncbi:MAG: hypothetical protein ACFE85_04455 [Candidatus Hodarchaeota archaeon]
MIKIEDYLLDSLNRINFSFKNEELTTECINSHKGLVLLGESFGPFEKGKKYRLKYFKAIPFIQNNILKISAHEKCDNVDVQRYAISERDDQKLVQRENKNFLNKIKESKIFMENEVNKNIKPKIDLDRFNSYTTNLIDSRLLKVLKLARAELTLDDEQRLTTSEKILYARLFNLIKVWRKFFLTDNQ